MKTSDMRQMKHEERMYAEIVVVLFALQLAWWITLIVRWLVIR
jgi:hypothetical protein